MVEIEKPRIECVENPGDASYGKYVVEPLERGYGTTLGNSLRRILLSSLPGTAVTSIRIAGVQHEFSTIPGVKEDVTEIVLNIKGIIAKLYSEGVKTVFIEASGECVVTAGDIKCDSDVEILNPDLHQHFQGRPHGIEGGVVAIHKQLPAANLHQILPDTCGMEPGKALDDIRLRDAVLFADGKAAHRVQHIIFAQNIQPHRGLVVPVDNIKGTVAAEGA